MLSEDAVPGSRAVPHDVDDLPRLELEANVPRTVLVEGDGPLERPASNYFISYLLNVFKINYLLI